MTTRDDLTNSAKRPNDTDGAKEDWRRAHRELERIAETRTRLDCDEAHWLVVAAREGTHARLGYASFVEYVERLFGYSPRFTLEKLRVADALERLPQTASALRSGSLTWSAARELTRVAIPETETEWLAASSGKTARDVERLVSGHAPGNRPNDAPDAALRRHVIRLEVSSETLAVFREAMAKLRRDAGASLDDDAAVLMLARHVLGGPTDEGRANYQVSLSICERCRRGFQSGRGAVFEVDQDMIAMATCDSQSTAPVDKSTHVGTTRAGTGNEPRADGEEARRRNFTKRASQSIPPGVRRHVLRRDERRCRVPGCRHAVFLDVHHVDARGEGGGHDPANLVTLCGAHHRALHRGELIVNRDESGNLRFWHADGSPYGQSNLSVGLIAARAGAFRALRSLGFRETESKVALDRAVEDLAGPEATPTTEVLLRRALRELSDAA